MNDTKLIVGSAVSETGIKIRMAICEIPEVIRRQNAELKAHIKTMVKSFNVDELLQSPILTECKKFYEPFGMTDAQPPGEWLLRLIQKSGSIPNINNVVDCYNIVSAETLLSIGAHDLDHITGDVQFKICNGSERYTPLFGTETEPVNPGEYACMDDKKIICRMDIKQCDETKITKDTVRFMIYVQGNSAVTDENVLKGLQKVCDNLENFTGSTCKILN